VKAGSAVLNTLQRVHFSRADAFVAFCGWDPRRAEARADRAGRVQRGNGLNAARDLNGSNSPAWWRAQSWANGSLPCYQGKLQRKKLIQAVAWLGQTANYMLFHKAFKSRLMA
jgi:hypothetical protein